MIPCDVIGLGEILWDCFPGHRTPGGAPANVAFQAQQLGLRAMTATRVGDDDLGRDMLTFLSDQGLSTELVQIDPLHATGRVDVTLDAQGKATYRFLEDSAWDFIELTPAWRQAFASARAVCFGTLAQRSAASRAAVLGAVAATPPACVRLFDINLRPPFYDAVVVRQGLELATVCKLNDEELPVVADLLGLDAGSLETFAAGLMNRFKAVTVVCVTRGADGSFLADRNQSLRFPAEAVRVVDTVGAGDGFSAACLYGLLNGWELKRTGELATRLAGLVAGRSGAMPVLKSEIAGLLGP